MQDTHRDKTVTMQTRTHGQNGRKAVDRAGRRHAAQGQTESYQKPNIAVVYHHWGFRASGARGVRSLLALSGSLGKAGRCISQAAGPDMSHAQSAAASSQCNYQAAGLTLEWAAMPAPAGSCYGLAAPISPSVIRPGCRPQAMALAAPSLVSQVEQVKGVLQLGFGHLLIVNGILQAGQAGTHRQTGYKQAGWGVLHLALLVIVHFIECRTLQTELPCSNPKLPLTPLARRCSAAWPVVLLSLASACKHDNTQ